MVNECYRDKAPCQQICIDTADSYYCTCHKGFRLEIPTIPYSCPNSLDCSSAYTDLIIIVDNSFNICPGTQSSSCSFYAYILEWVYAITLRLSPNTRLGMLLYSNSVTTYFSLNAYQNLANAQARIRQAPFGGRAGTALSAAIREARVNQFTAARGDRLGVENVMLLLINDATDMTQVSREANLAKVAGITVLAVSITGRVSEAQLLQVVSPPWSNSNSHRIGHLDLKHNPNLDPNRTTRLDPRNDYDVECVGARICQTSTRENCNNVLMDIAIAIDGNPPSFQAWQLLKTSLKLLTDELSKNLNIWRIAFITFTQSPGQMRQLNADQSSGSLRNYIDSIQGRITPSASRTNWVTALRTIRTSMFTAANGDRSGVLNSIIFVGFNPPVSNSIALLSETNELQKLGIKVFSYGWSTRVTDKYLLKFASTHPHIENQNWALIDLNNLASLPSMITQDLCRPSKPYTCKMTEYGGDQCFCPLNNCDVVPTNGSKCLDINECAKYNGGCQHICSNTLGAYACSCRTGFKLSGNKKKCEDIDECTSPSVCTTGLCVNSYGSFYCLVRSALSVQGRLASDGTNNDGEWEGEFPLVAVVVPICLLVLFSIIAAALIFKAMQDKKKTMEGENKQPAKASVDMFTWRSSRSKPVNQGLGVTDFNFFSNGDMGIGTWGGKEEGEDVAEVVKQD